MILCLTLNPAIDRTARVPRVVLGEILRPTELIARPGGKGVNVARAARILGADVVTSGVAGGHPGRWIVEQLAVEGLNPRFIEQGEESRTTYVVVGDDGRTVIVYETGRAQPERAFDDLIQLIQHELLIGCDFVVIAGSVPPGVDPAYLGRIVAACNQRNVPCLVDARGESLLAGIAQRPAIAKGNRREFADAGLGSKRADPVVLARSALKAGAETSIVTLGANGAVACQGSQCWRVTVPRQRVVNSVGAGDVYTAGLVVALSRSHPFVDALVHGGAAAAASVLKLGAGDLDRNAMERLISQVHARPIVG